MKLALTAAASAEVALAVDLISDKMTTSSLKV